MLSILRLFNRISFHTIIYGMSGIINKLAELVLLPIFTRFLTRTEIGELDILLIGTNILFITLQYGLGSALIKYSLYDQNVNQKKLFNTALIFLIVINIGVIFILTFFSAEISILFFSTEKYKFAIKLLIFSIFFNCITIIPLAYLRTKNYSIKYASLISFKFISQLLLNIVFVVVLKYEIIGIVYAALLNNIFYAIFSLWFIRNLLSWDFKYEYLKGLLKFGIYLIPLGIMSIFLNLFDRFLIIKTMSPEAVATYSIGFKTAQIVYLCISAFQVAWPYFMYTIVKQENATRVFSQLFKIYFILINCLAIGISLFAYDFIPLVFGTTYLNSYHHIYFIAIGFVYMGIYYYTAVGLNINNKTNIQSIIIIISGIIKIIIAGILIRYYGIVGIAFSVLINFSIVGIVAVFVSFKYYHFDISQTKINSILIIEIIGFTYINYINTNFYQLDLYYRSIIFIGIIFLIIILFFGKSFLSKQRNYFI